MLAFRLHDQRLIPIVVRNGIPQDDDSAGCHIVPEGGSAPQTNSPDELTRQLPRGLYTTFSTNHNGTRVMGLSAHLDRLNLPTLASRADLQRALSQLAESNAPGESRFRVIVSDSDGTAYVIVQAFAPPAKEIYERGVNVVTADLVRHDARRKDSGFIAASQSQRAQVGGDVYEVLLTKNGKIYEGMTSNFYAVIPSVIASDGRVGGALPPYRDQSDTCPPIPLRFGDYSGGQCQGAIPASGRGLFRRAGVSVRKVRYSTANPPRNDEAKLVTARTGILLGVTRRAVLRLARGEGMGIEYRAPRSEENFVEAFLTSSSRGIVPIISIDGIGVGEGRVGTWTERLINAYQAYVEERSERLIE